MLSCDVKFNGVVRCDARATAGGGTLEMRGFSAIDGGSAHIGDGGGVYIKSGALIMRAQSEIRNSYASVNGASVFMLHGTVDMYDRSAVRRGYAANCGGAMTIIYGHATQHDDSIVDSCSSGSHGGGYCAIQSAIITLAGRAVVINCSIPTTRGGGKGGACYIDSGAGAAAGGRVRDIAIDCRVPTYPLLPPRAGASFILSQSATVERCYASLQGGAVYATYGALFTSTGGTIRACVAPEGGALFLVGYVFTHLTTATVISNTIFLQNAALVTGGALFLSAGGVSISGCTFDRNVARFGGGLSIQDTITTVANCVFTDNGATAGGAMQVAGVSACAQAVSFGGGRAWLAQYDSAVQAAALF